MADAWLPPVVPAPAVCVALPVVPSADAELAPDVAPVSVAEVMARVSVRLPAPAVCRDAMTWQVASINKPDMVCPRSGGVVWGELPV